VRTQPLRILLVEDDEDDYCLTRDLIQEIPGNSFQLEWQKDYERGLAAMASNQHDVYLIDYRLNGPNGLDLLREARSRGCQGPIILLTGQGEREVDLAAMQAGAADYLMKGRIDAPLLERSIRYALERQRDREALRRARDELEKRVQERTAELEKANTTLRVEIGERQRAEEALKDADRRKDEFLAMLAHELRNPLAPIRNGLHILRMPNATNAISDRVIQMMEQQVRNLTRLVDDLLDVSRITRGKIQLQQEVLDLAVVVNHAVETVRPLTEAQRHHLGVSLPSEPVLLRGDATRLEQVLCNLLTNAAKYTEPGGHIDLTVARDGTSIVLRVRDTGIGIAAELLPRIFDLFIQDDRSLARSQGGLGIGLTLVRKLVEMMGGTVTAQSAGCGKGSEFIVRLPCLPDPLVASAAEALTTMPPSRRLLRVLIVEDRETLAETAALMLRLWGHDVRIAHDGPTALAAARTYRPDVILLDIGLPGMNGYDVARQLRAEAGRRRPLIAAVTGYGQDEDRRRSQEAGCDHHLVKPIDPPALHAFLACAESLRQSSGAPLQGGA
jgi:two-component system CheB/CheR fusion protein